MSIGDVNEALAEHYQDRVLVYGQGPVPCAVMLVGEAPGAHEVENNMPFCGQAGKNLNSFLEQARLDRSSLYITNVVKFRPTKQGASGRLSNRTPTVREMDEAAPFLLDEIECVRPRLIVTLGNSPLRAITGDRNLRVGDAHGACVRSVRPALSDICVFALYHPASLIYNPGLRQTYSEDLAALRRKIGEMHD